MVGAELGALDGNELDGSSDGAADGNELDGAMDGAALGAADGKCDGASEGADEGTEDGGAEGTADGAADGCPLGAAVGCSDGAAEGTELGAGVAEKSKRVTSPNSPEEKGAPTTASSAAVMPTQVPKEDAPVSTSVDPICSPPLTSIFSTSSAEEAPAMATLPSMETLVMESV